MLSEISLSQKRQILSDSTYLNNYCGESEIKDRKYRGGYQGLEVGENRKLLFDG